MGVASCNSQDLDELTEDMRHQLSDSKARQEELEGECKKLRQALSDEVLTVEILSNRVVHAEVVALEWRGRANQHWWEKVQDNLCNSRTNTPRPAMPAKLG